MAQTVNTNLVFASGAQLKTMQLEQLASDPTGAGVITGRMYYNVTSNTGRYYNGTSWLDFPGIASVTTDSVTGSPQITFSGNGTSGSPLQANITDGTVVLADLVSTLGLDDLGGARVTGPVDVNSQKITNLATPTANTDATTKGYVDSKVGALAGNYTGAGATYAALPAVDTDGTALEAGDIAILSAVDGIHLAGFYAWDGSVWQFAAPTSAPAAQATTAVIGLAALATQAQVNTGTDNLTIVTPLTLRTNLGTRGSTALFGDGTVGPFNVAHGMTVPSAGLEITVTDATTGFPVLVDTAISGANIVVTPVAAVSANAYRLSWMMRN
jgi:hypothetical protein